MYRALVWAGIWVGSFVCVRLLLLLSVPNYQPQAKKRAIEGGVEGLYFFNFFCPPVDMRNIEGYVQVCRGKGNVPRVVGGLGWKIGLVE